MGAPSVLFTLLGITEDSSEVLCFPLAVRSRADENRIAALERKVGQRRVEIDFLRRCLLACRRAAEAAGIDHQWLVCAYVEKQMILAIPIPLSGLGRCS